MNKYDIQDTLLTSSGPNEIIDLGETGGSEHAHIVIEGATNIVEGSDSKAGPWTNVIEHQETSPAGPMRIPLNCPRYIRLKTDGTNTILTVRV